MNKAPQEDSSACASMTMHSFSFVVWKLSSFSQCLYWKTNKMMYYLIWCCSTFRSYFSFMLLEPVDHGSSLIYVIDVYAYIFLSSLFYISSVILVTSLFCSLIMPLRLMCKNFSLWFVAWIHKPSFFLPFISLWIKTDTQRYLFGMWEGSTPKGNGMPSERK